jgi:uncharacterized protein (TIGR03437 family)
VQRNLLVDSKGIPFLLRGVNMSGLESADTAAEAAMTVHTFRILQQRWNTNAVRLPIGVDIWKREGAAYLSRVASIVAAANGEGLVVILAAVEPGGAGLPGSDVLAFWHAAAQRFRETPAMIFALYHEPSPRRSWQDWRDAMQPLVDAIRGAGAGQIVAAPSFHDNLEFQGFTSSDAIRDASVLYETHPTYNHGLTDDNRNTNFGFMTANYPVLAGSWGMSFGRDDASCRAIPRDLAQANDLLYQTLAWFDRFNISWTVSDFRPGSLIQEYDNAPVTQLTALGVCAASSNPRLGIGEFLLFYLSGDLHGFGSLDRNLIANAASVTISPLAPGLILSIYGQSLGPLDPVGARLDSFGRVATSLGEVEIFFDGVPGPVLLAGSFQVNVQVPYEVAGKDETVIRLVYRGIPSNALTLPVVQAAPGIFTHLGLSEAAALNQDTSINSRDNPAERGTILSVFVTGCGQTLPPSTTGELARALASHTQAIDVRIAGRPVTALYAGPAPGLSGVTQINVRVPSDLSVIGPADSTSIAVTAGSQTSRSVIFWAK